MLKRIFKLVVAVDQPNGTKHTFCYELGQPIPRLPGEPDDHLLVAHIDYEEEPDEEGELTGLYRVMCAPDEGSDLHKQGIGVIVEHSINEVLRSYDAVALKDMGTVIENFNKSYLKAIEEGSEEAEDATEPEAEPQAAQATKPDAAISTAD
jgi:hypothetical protein